MNSDDVRPVRRALNAALLNLHWDAETLDAGEPAAVVAARIAAVKACIALLEGGGMTERADPATVDGSFIWSGPGEVTFHLPGTQSVEVKAGGTLIYRDASGTPAIHLPGARSAEMRAKGIPERERPYPAAPSLPSGPLNQGPPPGLPLLRSGGPLIPVTGRRLIRLLKRALEQRPTEDLRAVYDHVSSPQRLWPPEDRGAPGTLERWVILQKSGFTLVHEQGVLDFTLEGSRWLLRHWDAVTSKVSRTELGTLPPEPAAVLARLYPAVEVLSHIPDVAPKRTTSERPVPTAVPVATPLAASAAKQPTRKEPVPPPEATDKPADPLPLRPGPPLPRISWVTALRRAERGLSPESPELLAALQRVLLGCIDQAYQLGKRWPADLPRSTQERGFAVLSPRGCVYLRREGEFWLADDWDSGLPAQVRQRRLTGDWRDVQDPEWPSAPLLSVLNKPEAPTRPAPVTEPSPPPPPAAPPREQWLELLSGLTAQMRALMQDAPESEWLNEMRRVASGLTEVAQALSHPEWALSPDPGGAGWPVATDPQLDQPFFVVDAHHVWAIRPQPDGYAAWSWDASEPTRVRARTLDLTFSDPLDSRWPPPALRGVQRALETRPAHTEADQLLAYLGGGFRLFKSTQEALGGGPETHRTLRGEDGLTRLLRQDTLLWQVPTRLEAGNVQRRLAPRCVRTDVLIWLLGGPAPGTAERRDLDQVLSEGRVALASALKKAAPWQRHLLRTVDGVQCGEECAEAFGAHLARLAPYLHVEEVRAADQQGALLPRLALLATLCWLSALDEEGNVPRQQYADLCVGVHEMIRRVARPAGTSEEQITARIRGQFGLEAHGAQVRATAQVLGAAGVHLAVLPTGSGKTLIFQAAAQILGDLGGQTVVITPLQALIGDQVREAQRRQLTADGISGRLDAGERQGRLEAFQAGRTRLLYLTPEQLERQDVQRALEARPPDLWVFDEAHALTQWGGSFRPSYLRAVSSVARLSGDHARVLLTTATLTYEETQKLQTLFAPFGPLRVAVHEFELPETLHIEVRPTPDEQQRLALMVEALTAIREAGEQALIYCATPQRAEDLRVQLERYFPGNIGAYHGALSAEQRAQREQEFLTGHFSALTVTAAFGLGMNNPNVRLVIHADPPASIEDYVQQVGRATRTAYRAESLIVCDPASLERQFRLLSAQLLQREEYRRIFAGLRQFAQAAGEAPSLWMTPLEVALIADVGSDRANSHLKGDLALYRLEQQGVVRLEATRPVALTLTDTQEQADGDAASRLSGGASALWTYLQMPSCVAETVSDLMAATRQSAEQVLSDLSELQERRLLRYDYQLSALFNKGTRVGALRATLERLFTVQRGMLDLLRAQVPLPGGSWRLSPEQVLLHFRETQPRLQASGTDIQLALQFWALVDGATFSTGTREILLTLRGAAGEALTSLQARADSVMMASTQLVELLYARTPRSGRLVRASFSYQDVYQASRERLPVGHLLSMLHRLRLLTLGSGSDLRAVAHGIRYLPDHGRTLTTLDHAALEADNARRFARVHLVERLLSCTSEEQVRALVRRYFEQPLESIYQEHFQQAVAQAPSCRHSDLQRILDLSPAQRRIVTSRERALLVVAGPGSGKTRTIVHRVAHLLRVERVVPERVLVVTFNRAASREVRKRLYDLIGADAASVDALTFHALALRILNLNLAELAIQSGVARGEALKSALAAALLRLRGDQSEDTEAEEQARLDSFVGRYDYVLIDEYQDIDEEQYGVVRLLVGHGQGEDQERTRYNLWAVGDDDQTLYQFRGARPQFLQQFEDEYATKRQLLTENYRSGPAIVAASNALIGRSTRRVKTEPDEQVRAVRPPLQGPEVFYHQRAEVQARSFVMQEIAHLLRDQTISPSDIAVLAPRWTSLAPTWATLREAGVEARLLRGGTTLPPSLSRSVQRALETLDSRTGGMAEQYSLWQALTDAAADAGLHQQAPGLIRALGAARQIDDERRDTGLFGAPVLTRTLLSDLRDRLTEGDASGAGHSGVTCSTFHSAKGLEFKVVFVIAEKPRSTRGKSPEEAQQQWEEQLRAYYVGLTRARDQLYLIDTPQIPCAFLPPLTSGAHVLRTPQTATALPDVGTVVLTYDQYGDIFLGHRGTMTKRAQEVFSTAVLTAPESCQFQVQPTPSGQVGEFANAAGRLGSLSIATTKELLKLFPERHWHSQRARILESTLFYPEDGSPYLVPTPELTIRTLLDH